MNYFTGADIDYDAIYNPQPPAWVDRIERLKKHGWVEGYDFGTRQEWRKNGWTCCVWFKEDDWEFTR